MTVQWTLLQCIIMCCYIWKVTIFPGKEMYVETRGNTCRDLSILAAVLLYASNSIFHFWGLFFARSSLFNFIKNGFNDTHNAWIRFQVHIPTFVGICSRVGNQKMSILSNQNCLGFLCPHQIVSTYGNLFLPSPFPSFSVGSGKIGSNLLWMDHILVLNEWF